MIEHHLAEIQQTQSIRPGQPESAQPTTPLVRPSQQAEFEQEEVTGLIPTKKQKRRSTLSERLGGQ